MNNHEEVLDLLDSLYREVIRTGNQITDKLDIQEARFFKARLDEFKELIGHMAGRVIQDAYDEGWLEFRTSPREEDLVFLRNPDEGEIGE